MDKAYRMMKWLNVEQAADWLKRLTGEPYSAVDLLNLGDSKQCDVYADTTGLAGVDINSSTCERVFGVGFQKVLNVAHLKYAGQDVDLEIYFERAAYNFKSRGVTTEYPLVEWAATTPMKNLVALFKPDDILALYEKIKPEAKQTPNHDEIDRLYHELKAERTARHAAERRVNQAEEAPKQSLLIAVATMLEILNTPRHNVLNQPAAILEIQERNQGKRGLSKRNLEILFATANKAKQDAE